mmetsp:Transcript_13913/g.43624  ORF Transcript_13913/g.43624 Transcript_13913/m.43624 type:complete len:248 (+) Transcript_13913:448-1191(+)
MTRHSFYHAVVTHPVVIVVLALLAPIIVASRAEEGIAAPARRRRHVNYHFCCTVQTPVSLLRGNGAVPASLTAVLSRQTENRLRPSLPAVVAPHIRIAHQHSLAPLARHARDRGQRPYAGAHRHLPAPVRVPIPEFCVACGLEVRHAGANGLVAHVRYHAWGQSRAGGDCQCARVGGGRWTRRRQEAPRGARWSLIVAHVQVLLPLVYWYPIRHIVQQHCNSRATPKHGLTLGYSSGGLSMKGFVSL